jgi:very-short-patch-repair endonuclease
MTDAERKLWFALRDRRFADFKFRRQVPVGPFVADFVCYSSRLIIELDGGQHAESMSDRRRDAWLVANNFRVLRFWNNDVMRNQEGVLSSILEALHERAPHPARGSRGHPSPARGEGTSGAAP